MMPKIWFICIHVLHIYIIYEIGLSCQCPAMDYVRTMYKLYQDKCFPGIYWQWCILYWYLFLSYIGCTSGFLIAFVTVQCFHVLYTKSSFSQNQRTRFHKCFQSLVFLFGLNLYLQLHVGLVHAMCSRNSINWSEITYLFFAKHRMSSIFIWVVFFLWQKTF